MNRKKKLLFVINHFCYSNGVAMALRSIIENLDRDLFDCSILAIYRFDEDFAGDILKYITRVQGLGFYFHGLDRIVSFVPAGLWRNIFIRGDYDLVISFQYGAPTKWVSTLKSNNKICWMHGYDVGLKLMECYRKFKKMITVSQVARTKLIKSGFLEEQVEYCYNIIDETRIKKLSDEPCDLILNHKITIITVARLSKEKGFDRYINVIKKLVANGTYANFLIVGGGNEFDSLSDIVKQHNLEQYVVLLGQQKNPYKFMKKADIYFCGSFTEGFNTSCQEAALLGIPVVSTDVDGARELIEQAKCGTVIPNNEECIYNSLQEIINDRRTLEEWKSNANIYKEVFYKKNRVDKITRVLLDN